jgi:hypothetical protein
MGRGAAAATWAGRGCAGGGGAILLAGAAVAMLGAMARIGGAVGWRCTSGCGGFVRGRVSGRVWDRAANWGLVVPLGGGTVPAVVRIGGLVALTAAGTAPVTGRAGGRIMVGEVCEFSGGADERVTVTGGGVFTPARGIGFDGALVVFGDGPAGRAPGGNGRTMVVA